MEKEEELKTSARLEELETELTTVAKSRGVGVVGGGGGVLLVPRINRSQRRGQM